MAPPDTFEEASSVGGDLGRRVAERRRQLHLSVEEVADRSAMSPTYLRLLESSSSVRPSAAGLWCLSAALNTTVDALNGGGMETPPGRSAPETRPQLVELEADECRRLISPGGVGRVVFVGEHGPVALPVNFRCSDRGDIVYRTEGSSTLVPPAGGDEAAFEVDHLDDALTEGWSVLMTGPRAVITDPEEAQQAWSLGVVPWASGDRDVIIRIVPRHVTGRRLRRRASTEA